MEEKKVMSHIIKGVIISLIVIVLWIIGYFTDLSFTPWYSWLINGIMFISIIVACVHYANQKDNYVTFGNIFSYGFKTSAVIALIMVAYTLLSMTLLFPEVKEKVIEVTRQSMEEKGNMTDSQIETTLEFTRKYFLLFGVIGSIIGTLIFGLIASLIGGAIAKKKPVNPLNQMG